MAAQALLLRFNTDLAGAQQNIAKFASDTAGNLARVAQGSYNAKKSLDLIKEAGGGLKLGLGLAAGALVAVEALKLVVSGAAAARASLEKLVKIGAGAAQAGVGTSFFQAWTGQAKALNLEVSDMVAMLEHARRASTDTIGEDGGPVKNASRDRVKQNILAGYLDKADLSSFNAADTQNARFPVQLGLLDELEKKGLLLAKFDLAKTFFGEGFETQLRNGVDIIGKMRTSLDGLESAGGARIIPESEIRNAENLDKRLQEIDNRIATGMKPITETIVALQQDWLGKLISIKELWLGILGVVCKVVGLLQWVEQEKNNLRAIVEDALGLPVQLPMPRPQGHPGEQHAPAITVHGDKSKSLPSLTPNAPRAAASPRADEVETYIKSLQKLAAAEAAEADTLGLGNKAKTEAVDLAKALEAAKERGAPLTAKETAQVKALADAYIAAKDKIDDFKKSEESAKAQAQFFGQTLEGAVEKLATGGGSLRSALKDIVKLLEQAAIKALILGEGPLATLFGTSGSGAGGTAGLGGIFGQLLNAFPKFAEGGDLPSGGFGIAGERGPELIQGPATITPFKQINAALDSGGGGRGGHAVAMTIDVRGAQGNAEIQTMIASGVQAGMNAVHSKIARDIGPISQRWDRRFG